MRLIDADKMLKRIESWNTSDAIDKALYNFTLNRIIEQPTVGAVPIQYILTTIREWNRDGYAESAEELEILLMNWDKENTEWSERKAND